MTQWNFNLDEAPKGHYKTVTKVVGKNHVEVTSEVHVPETILAAGNEGVVTFSYWLPKQERWNMFTKKTPPIAWMPMPKHPEEKQ